MRQWNYNEKIEKKTVKKENKAIKNICKILIFLIILLIILPSDESVRWGILYKYDVEDEFGTISMPFETKELLSLDAKNVKSRIFSFYNLRFYLAQIKEKDDEVILVFLKESTWSFDGGKAVYSFKENGQTPPISYITVITLEGKSIYEKDIDTGKRLISISLDKIKLSNSTKINITISNSKVIQYKLRFMPS